MSMVKDFVRLKSRYSCSSTTPYNFRVSFLKRRRMVFLRFFFNVLLSLLATEWPVSYLSILILRLSALRSSFFSYEFSLLDEIKSSNKPESESFSSIFYLEKSSDSSCESSLII